MTRRTRRNITKKRRKHKGGSPLKQRGRFTASKNIFRNSPLKQRGRFMASKNIFRNSPLKQRGRFTASKNIFRKSPLAQINVVSSDKRNPSPRKQKPSRASRAASSKRPRSPPQLNMTKNKSSSPRGRVAYLYKPKSFKRIKSAPLG